MILFNQHEYLTTLATKHKLIKHSETDKHFGIISSVFNLEEFQANMVDVDGVQVLSVNLDDKSAAGSNDNTICDNIFNTFWIVKKATSGDFNDKHEARQTCLAIANNFAGKMRADCNKMQQNALTPTTLKHLKPLTFSIRAYEMPIGDNYIGVQVNYRIEPPTSMTNDESVWME